MAARCCVFLVLILCIHCDSDVNNVNRPCTYYGDSLAVSTDDSFWSYCKSPTALVRVEVNIVPATQLQHGQDGDVVVLPSDARRLARRLNARHRRFPDFAKLLMHRVTWPIC